MRAILRAAAYELIGCPDVPAKVIINEYLNVAHAFFEGEEPGVVNGVLDRVARKVRARELNGQVSPLNKPSAACRRPARRPRLPGWAKSKSSRDFSRRLARAAPGAFDLKDDAAVLSVPPGADLVVTSDVVVAGVHFFPDDAPGDIARKALAVNLSDLAAKGAEPLAYNLNIALPGAPQTELAGRVRRRARGLPARRWPHAHRRRHHGVARRADDRDHGVRRRSARRHGRAGAAPVRATASM